MKFSFILFLLITLLGCKEPVMDSAITNSANSKVNYSQEIQHKNIGRDTWQQPSTVLDKFGDLSDKVVADIGAGTGFFTFRLLFRAQKVIAIDIDTSMIEIIESFKLNLDKEIQDKLETRLALPDDSTLKNQEVDNILIINTVAYIPDRVNYLRKLKNKLKSNGKLMIVDFKSRSLPFDAPASNNRIPLFKMEKELLEAGYKLVESDDRSLEYQYIIIAE